MSRLLTRAAVLPALAATLIVLSAAPASAHERRTVGNWTFVVGWGDEPAYAGFKNSVQLRLSDRTQKPVVDLGDTLKVEVTFGTERREVELEPNFLVGRFGEPGDYRAWMIPTRPGTYGFRFTGTIKGDEVDVTFTCSEETFDCIKQPSEIQFPAKDPAVAQVAGRLERESARLADVQDDANLARLLAIIAVALGTLALLSLAVTTRGRRKAAAG